MTVGTCLFARGTIRENKHHDTIPDKNVMPEVMS